jgi:uncharacterized protein (UPF0335 family)
MYYLTERQLHEAIDACERIEAASAKLQDQIAKIILILERIRKRDEEDC